MLTAIQADTIKGVKEMSENAEVFTITSKSGVSSRYSYGLVSVSRRELIKLKDRRILSFKRGYCEPRLTRHGLEILQQYEILKLLEENFSDCHTFNDAEISKAIGSTHREVRELLNGLKNLDLIDGYSCASSGQEHRLVSVWITGEGRRALREPDNWWDRTYSVWSQSRQAGHAPVQPIFPKMPHNDAAPSSSVTLKHIQALKELIYTMPEDAMSEDRRSEMMAILKKMSQAVEPTVARSSRYGIAS